MRTNPGVTPAVWLVAVAAFASPCSIANPASTTTSPDANDFPTQARVEYVLRCMDANGGQNYNTLYACVCAIDKIAESFSYAEFSEAETFALLRSTPGEQGGVFRDPDRAGVLQKRYQEVDSEAERSCLVNRQQTPPAQAPKN